MVQAIKKNNETEDAHKWQIINLVMSDQADLPDLVTTASLSLFQYCLLYTSDAADD